MSSRSNRYLWIVGASISTFGAGALWLAAGVWVKDVTGSNAFAGLAFLAYLAPTLLAPLIGLVADRVRRKPLLLWGSIGLAGWVLLALLAQDDRRTWLIYVVLVGLGIGANLTAAAGSAFTTLVVPYEDLGKVNAFMRTVKEIGLFSAPLIGVTLYTAFGIDAVVQLNAVTLLIAAVCVYAVRIDEPRPTPTNHKIGQELLLGAEYLFRSPNLRVIVFALGGSLLAFGFFETAIFAVVDEGLGKSTAFVGVLSATKGVGSVAGGFLSARLIDQIGEARLTAVGLILIAVGTAAIQTPQVIVVAVACFSIGLGIPMAVVGLYTAVQRQSPAQLQGRVFAAADALVTTPQVVSVALGAVLIGMIGFRPMLAAAAVAVGVSGVLLYLRRSVPEPVLAEPVLAEEAPAPARDQR